jgi:hypothetical protein
MTVAVLFGYKFSRVILSDATCVISPANQSSSDLQPFNLIELVLRLTSNTEKQSKAITIAKLPEGLG